MESTFGWTQVARSDVAKATAILKSEEQGVRDEIGFLTLHQGFADRFFPGTSVLQTRLRYALFVPWQIEDLEMRQRSGATAEQRLRASERKLVARLAGAGDGVIGQRSANHDPAQPPSMIYWTALGLWGILNSPSPNQYPGRGAVLSRIDSHKWNSERVDGQTSSSESIFFALPQRPSDWYSDARLTFRLSAPERRYLAERIEETTRIAPSSQGKESLLARLVTLSKRPHSWAKVGYDSSFLRDVADAEDRNALQVATAAASLAHIGRAAYSALVETLAKADGLDTSSRFIAELESIVASKRGSALSCDLEAVESFIGTLEPRFRKALELTLAWLRMPRRNVMELRMPYCDSEQARKGRRARLPKTAHAQVLRSAWIASNVPEAQPLNYRWHRIGVLLDDLHDIHG